MANKTRLIISGSIIVISATYLLATKLHFDSPYQSLSKQRATVSHKPTVTPVRMLDSISIVNDLAFLASDSCEGRMPGTEGYERAAQRILSEMRATGLDSFDHSFIQPFTGEHYGNGSNLTSTLKGKNIIGWIKGTKFPDQYIVISAHYDHVGTVVRTNPTRLDIYHGASDNASGTACILAMAAYFKQHPLPCSLIFAAFDREETGMEGSTYFVENSKRNIIFNLNIDMIARNDSNELFICGIKYHPSFIDIVDEIQKKTNAKLLMGHDNGGSQNWTDMSDHYPFYKDDIPFLYLGVEDHVDYHKPGDTFEKINLATYIENCNAAALLLMAAQRKLFE